MGNNLNIKLKSHDKKTIAEQFYDHLAEIKGFGGLVYYFLCLFAN